MRNKLTPKSDECLFILTDSDLYPQDNWTFVFGVTRPNLRTLVQSIARHDSAFPHISQFRSINHIIKRSHTHDVVREEAEGGTRVTAETVYPDQANPGVKSSLFRAQSLKNQRERTLNTQMAGKPCLLNVNEAPETGEESPAVVRPNVLKDYHR